MLRPYKITHYDRSITEIADRFQIESPSYIIALNTDLFNANSEDRPFDAALVGQTIWLPDDPSAARFDWEPYTSPGRETLAAVCRKNNRDPRIDPRHKGHGIPSPPWLLPQPVLDAYANADLRAGHGPDADKVTLAQGEIVVLPFPRVRSGPQHIKAAVNATTTFVVTPAWVAELVNAYESIRERTRIYHRAMNHRRELQHQGQREIQYIYLLREVLRLTIDHPSVSPVLHASEVGSLRRLDGALRELGNTAQEAMFDRVFETLRPDMAQLADKLGRQILDDIRGARFVELTKKLCAVWHKYPRTMTELSDVLSYAYEVLDDSPLSNDAHRDINSACDYLARVRPVASDAFRAVDAALANEISQLTPVPPPNDALGAIISTLSLAGVTIGNTAGPSTLFVALVRLRALVVARRAAFLKARAVENVVEIFRKDAVITIAIAMNAITNSEADREEIVSLQVAIVGGAPRPAFTPFLKTFDDRITGRSMAGRGWLAGIGFLNVALLGCSLYHAHKVGWNTSDMADVAGAAIGSIATGASVLALVGLIGARAASIIGRGIAGADLALSAVELALTILRGDAREIALSQVSAAGSMLLLLSMMAELTGPILATLGGILVTGSAFVSISEQCHGMTLDDFEDLFRPGPEVWWRKQERMMEERSIFARVAAHDSALRERASALRQLMKNTSFLLIDQSQATALEVLVRQKEWRDVLVAPISA